MILACMSEKSFYLPTNFDLLLYQFIKAEILNETDKYISITITIVSISLPVWLREIPPSVATRSIYPIAIAKEEFLVKFKYWLVSGGIITLRACGKITKFITLEGFNPIDSAASL